ncbi:ectonucleotide pyrophosphatase/phosphodiesterase family member 5-like [Argopecten irradians]|uniref:ectonucleotide pyrophosphatase/phosphodiesterase family member 5-like n=1 Tax=Argopecten irradians TaxID=31199 RepID=UPI0037132496
MAHPVRFIPILVLLAICLTRGTEGKYRKYAKHVLLVSMDGFRWDYIDKAKTPNFDRLECYGVRSKYVTNVYPTNTFPSHYTAITGLHAESHGIVGNYMYDPDFDEIFTIGTHDTKWWDGGEPAWITARKQGLTSGTMFWPGSEVEIQGLRPNRWYYYNESITYDQRLDIVIDMLKVDKLDFVTLYFHQPDFQGHVSGPSSQGLIDKVEEMDEYIGKLLHKLVVNGLKDDVNLLIMSDHGMTDIDHDNKLVEIWDLVDRSLIERTVDTGALMHVVPVSGQEQAVIDAINSHPHFTAYRKADIPNRLHYKNNRRIMPIFVMADEGWTITFDRDFTRRYTKKGGHGFDNRLMSMKSIFYAIGPNFKPNYAAPPFKSVDLYPLICELLGIRPAPNNGSLCNTADFLKPYRNYNDKFYNYGLLNLLRFYSMQQTRHRKKDGKLTYDLY